ncbi:uncharacterized protein E0L32_001914 [Thyridium curvatum]|uniref:mRNA export factor GLE1 n=1 Tax=Thyridium curvatum TaxID=1093900 RepID=A0A507ATT8_9PEZI|nr:uncharacterized protein E0L32_001765 [Thyridium curvatum]XP_030990050.1 uncharacterized protein E0L32_001914 [Thyridium curvatum]TPX08190.1 hypothetical protein E0L32_001765 [Thyridium curvatum]TPX08339.1 hypothetical protein E0L32_001914 [Thyridium curvatum]
MASSSPPARDSRALRSSRSSRQSLNLPIRAQLSDFLLDTRNSEEAHRRGFEEAEREHERIRRTAIDALNAHERELELKRIEEEQARERQRLAKEAEIARKEAELQALKAKQVPKPAPPPPSPKAPAAQATASKDQQAAALAITAPASQTSQPETAKSNSLNGLAAQKPAPATSATQGAKTSLFGPTPAASSPFGAPTPSSNQASSQVQKASPFAAPQPKPSISAVAQSAAATGSPFSQANGVPTPTQAPGPRQPASDRHIEVHKNLKELRKSMTEQAKTNPHLKKRMGDMRREIRKSTGQFVAGGARANETPIAKIVELLREALRNQVQSQLIDPGMFVLESRAPVPGETNEPQRSSLFLYLMNIFCKAVISQFINEASANPKQADAIGMVAAKIFSDVEFLWRGKSLIDMLIAKYRVVCPVLFGFRGNDKMEQARLRVGWRKEGGQWIPEQVHGDRMTGLGAGFAALTLRDFSKAKAKKNPWPPSVYWTAMARIINTPTEEISKTQCYVLKAMIANYEQKFMLCYGTAAVAALRCALIDFPARIPEKSSARDALPVVATSLRMETGLRLDQI